LEVAPVAPAARFVRIKSGSIESSQSFVPVAKRDSIGFGIAKTPSIPIRDSKNRRGRCAGDKHGHGTQLPGSILRRNGAKTKGRRFF